MTYLQIVNRVLALLREDTVSTTTSTTYSSLIGILVNQVKQEVEDSWNWTRLRSSILILTQPGFFKYTLTDAGPRFRFFRDRYGKPGVYNVNTNNFLKEVSSSKWMTHRLLTDTAQNEPMYFDANGVNDEDDPDVDLYPIPDDEYTISFNIVIPQPELDNDEDSIIVPSHVVVLGAWARAVSERGEDGGANFTEIEMKYQDALATAIAFDASMNEDELISEVV